MIIFWNEKPTTYAQREEARDILGDYFKQYGTITLGDYAFSLKDMPLYPNIKIFVRYKTSLRVNRVMIYDANADEILFQKDFTENTEGEKLAIKKADMLPFTLNDAVYLFQYGLDKLAELFPKKTSKAKTTSKVECLIMAFNKSVATELTERIMKLSKYDSFIPSEYQQALINFIMSGQGNGVVQAVAGSGKTTTIMQALNQLRNKHGTQNEPKIIEAKEFDDVVSYGNIIYKAGTTHSVCAKAGRKLVNFNVYKGKSKHLIMGSKYKKKVKSITLPPIAGHRAKLEGWILQGIKQYFSAMDLGKQKKLATTYAFQFADIIANLVGVMKNCGVGIFPNRPMTVETAQDLYYYYGIDPYLKGEKMSIWQGYVEPNIFELAITVLKESNAFMPKKITNKATGQKMTVSSVWDYDDMFYLVALYDAPMPTYDFVFLDECQDTNLVTQLLVKRIIGSTGRAIAVGDVAQAIYAFRGADANAMNEFTQAFKATTIPLSLCYRCGGKIISNVNQIYNQMSQSYPYTQIQALPQAPEGLVFNSSNVSSLSKEQLQALFNNKTGVICRKNAPLMALVVKLFVNGIPINFLGRNDLGEQVLGHFTKYQKIFEKGYSYDSNNKSHSYNKFVGSNVSDFITELTKYQKNEVDAYEKAGEIDKMEKVADEVKSVIGLLELLGQQYGSEGATAENVKNLVNDLFSEDALQNAVTLTSVHRSKGLEFHRAIILNYGEAFFPPWVSQEHLYEQECNMAYVALTRAERELIFIDL